MSDRKVPQLRFKEFNSLYEEVKLIDVTERVTRKNKERNDNNLTISAQYGLVNQKDYFNHQVASKDNSHYYLIKNGEFAYNKSYSKGYPAGVVRRLELYDKGAVSTLYICFKHKENINPLYLLQYFDSGKLNRQLLAISHEGARNHGLLNISVSDFFNHIKLSNPSLDEQEKIANFLSKVDEKISLLEKKVELINHYKQGILQKIFTDKNINYNYIKLGEIATIQTGKLDANAMEENGKYRFYTCAKEFYSINSYEFEGESLLISGNGANVGYIHYYDGKFNAYQRTYILQKFNQNIKYVKMYLDYGLKKRIYQEKNQGNTPYIVMSTLTDFKIPIPDLELQEKLSKIIGSIDSKNEILESKLELYKQFKKGLLQQMFV